MLFAYTYVPHTMDKMQEFIEYIFFQVWCQAPGGQPFGIELFDGQPELKAIVKAFHYSEAKGAYFFNGHIERIYRLFTELSPGQISQLKVWFNGNNDIAALCRNEPDVAIARYSDLETMHNPLTSELASFFKGLYSKDMLELAPMKSVIGEMSGHHSDFTKINKQGKCPFCGVHDVKSSHQSKREAYDHYLPKAKYPFNAINFHNLAPACHECNSTYKLSKDPLSRHNGERRKSFYPYQTQAYELSIAISLRVEDWSNIKPEEIQITIGPETLREEIDTWLDVYGILERYKAKCCGENDGKYWIEQVSFECENIDKTPQDLLAIKHRLLLSNPYAEANFLKVPFLDACQTAGIFSPKPTQSAPGSCGEHFVSG